MDAWAIAYHDLGLSSEEWGELTPRHVQALMKRQTSKMQREEWLVGVMASTSANYSMCAPKIPVTPEHYMIHKLPTPKPTSKLFGDIMAEQLSKLPAGFVKQG